jgi:hypothetical protein
MILVPIVAVCLPFEAVPAGRGYQLQPRCLASTQLVDDPGTLHGCSACLWGRLQLQEVPAAAPLFSWHPAGG